MLANFIRSADEIVQYDAYFTLLSIDEHTVHSLNVEKTELLSLWDSFKADYDALLKSTTTSSSSTSKDSSVGEVKVKYREVYRTYVRCLASINGLIDIKHQSQVRNHSDPARDNSIPNSNSTLQGTSSIIQLPPCDTDSFNGDYVTWPSFRDMFTALYINNNRLSNVVKLYHLRQKTTGEARDIVSTAPLTNDGFSLAWDNLKDRFENKRILFNAQMKLLLNLPTVTKESGVEIKGLQRTLKGCINTLQLMDINIDGWDPIFVFLCSTHLPNITLDLWEQSIENKSDVPRWKDLDAFLTNRYQTLESVSDIKYSASNSKKQFPKIHENNRNDGKSHFKSLHTGVAKPACVLCKENHAIRSCQKFLQMSVDNRCDTVKKQKLCFNCLASSHHIRQCKSQYSCNVCKQRHHSLLHRTAQNDSYNRSTSQQSSSQAMATTSDSVIPLQQAFPPTTQSFATSLDNQIRDQVILGTAMVNICVGDLSYTVRALIDSGSEASFVSERLQQSLRLETRRIETQITGLNEVVTARSTKVCLLKMRSPMDMSFEVEFEAYVIRRLTGHLPSLTSLGTPLTNLSLADANSGLNSKVDLVLGGNLYPKIILEGVRKDSENSLLAQNTVFGWIITGTLRESNPNPTLQSYFNAVTLERSITRFWEIEEPPKASSITATDKYCEDHFKRTTYRHDNGRFVVSLPFKPEFGNTLFVGPSRHLALTQYMRNETRLLKNPLYKCKYDSVISEYESLKHMTLVDSNTTRPSSNSYYLPHHAVLKPSSTTTKLRVVFNASSPSSNGKSLNDMLYAGPVLQKDLIILILRWRLFRYVFNADIEKMYRQILVNPMHTPYQRILFRSSLTEDVRDYELNTVTFGVNCAPYLAIRVLLKLAEENEEKYPIASWILKNCMYVDDVLAGAHTLHEGLRARDELMAVMQSAGFSLRKWTANCQDLLQDLPVEYLLDAKFLNLSENTTTKTLGLRWNAGADYFYFDPVNMINTDTVVTKRAVLSEIAKLFDPAGWLAPIIIVAKIIMQSIWLDNITWDDALPTLTLRNWQDFLTDYKNIKFITIPRWVKFTTDCSVELHGFCDASEKAYAAVLYLRIINSSGDVHVNLLTSKTRVAPVAKRSLPRLELCGAELLARLVSSIKPQLQICLHQMYLWTDSTIVLSWLRKPPCNWSTFVGNRVSLIAEMVGVEHWNHISSKDNPADVASRGTTAAALRVHDLWWNGPSWLQLQQSQWPLSTIPQNLSTDLEKKKPRSFLTNIQSNLDVLERFSSFPKAIRVISYIFRFFHATHPQRKKDFSFQSFQLSAAELKFVKERLIILCQRKYFVLDYNYLSKGKPLHPKSKLLSLTPFMDPKGILRVNGRLAQAPALTYDEKYPILLPYSACFTRLLLEFTHRVSIHGESQLMMRLIRTGFWILRLKKLVKVIIHSCKVCAIYKQRQIQQVMAALPPERARLERPFTTTGIDFAGPFEIKSYTGRKYTLTKGYVLVFVCFGTKAIHLEATSDMSTQVFLAAFARFFSRRCCPSVIISDNGTSFVGASRVLRQEYETVMKSVQNSLNSQLLPHELEWRFIPPGAPHMGGLWEAGVKSFKAHLKKEAMCQKYTFEEFITLLTRIEGCLNSRPISPQSEDPCDLTALTPGHFLTGGPLLSPPEIDLNCTPSSLINRWEKLRRLHQHFSQRWKDEYLKELHRRYKWQYPQKNLSLGDFVIIRHENLAPNQWRFGRVHKLYPGRDGKVRVVDIATTKGIITRPIVKVVLLPVNTN